MSRMLKSGLALGLFLALAPSQAFAEGPTLTTPIRNEDGTINSSRLIGLNVENGDGNRVGEIDEIVLTEDGNIQGIVIDVGGFLGIGTHPVLLNWRDVTFSGAQDDVKALVNATKDRLKALPAYEPNPD
jgi:sporulation protein YlmC with PRC-barrel domain